MISFVSETPAPSLAPNGIRGRLKLRIILIVVVLMLASGIATIWGLGGFEPVAIHPVPAEPGQVIAVNGFEMALRDAYVMPHSDGSATVYVNTTCRNTGTEGTDYLSWFKAAVIVGEPTTGGPDRVASFVYPSIDLPPSGAAVFNPTTVAVPCKIQANFPDGFGPADHVNVALGPVTRSPNQFSSIDLAQWEPTSYRWSLVRVPIVPQPEPK